MTVAGSGGSGDALSKLRIRRDEPVRGGGWLGRFVRLLVTVVVLALLGGAAWMFSRSPGMLADADRLMESVRTKLEVRVVLASVEEGRSADATVVATGYLQSRQQARIGARATGRIEAVLVEEGVRVAANDVLAILEHADLDASLAAAKASAARCRSELLEQDVLIARTQRDLQRAEKLLAGRTMTQAEFDTEKFEYDAAVARRESLQAALQLAEARVQEAEQLRENMFVRAPFAGTVISKDAELGESIMPGGMGEASGRGSVVTIADLEHLEVDCDVKEDFISRVQQGQAAEVAVDAVPGRRYRGRVRKVIPMGDRARATVKVRVALEDADERLFPEMSSTVYFLPADAVVGDGVVGDGVAAGGVQETKGVAGRRIFCPNDALQTMGGDVWVWVVGAEDRLKRVVVQVGAKKEGRTEIVNGLAGGERLVAGNSAEYRDGLAVKVLQ
ncbi:MAG: efflux RND transporter periplasmic adaptor subunit [Planctomyces sp.]